MTSAVQNDTSNSIGATAKAAASSTQLAKNFSSFLTLLTTQLQNQDPMKPLDSNEFTSQLVQFSQVEQSINTNSTLETILSMFQGNMTTQSIGYIGKQIEVDTAGARFGGDPVTWRYTLDGNAAASKISIVDGKGQLVRELAGSTGAGAKTFTWDGKDQNGNTLPAGSYTMKVTAADSSGKAVTGSVSTIATVTGVETADGAVTLVTKDGSVALDKVKGIYAPPGTAS